MINQEVLTQLLHYDPLSGVFTWRVDKVRARKGAVAGTITGRGYLRIRINSREYSAHRLAWLYVHGEWPDDHIDHVNHDRLDNRIGNLRDVPNKINHKNRGMNTNNTSGFTGVRWSKSKKRWKVQIDIDCKRIRLGSYKSLLDAVACRIRANKKYGYHDNHGYK